MKTLTDLALNKMANKLINIEEIKKKNEIVDNAIKVLKEEFVGIDKQIDEGKCPGLFWCTVATTCYPEWEREHKCYRCWKEYCKENEIEIDYGDII